MTENNDALKMSFAKYGYSTEEPDKEIVERLEQARRSVRIALDDLDLIKKDCPHYPIADTDDDHFYCSVCGIYLGDVDQDGNLSQWWKPGEPA